MRAIFVGYVVERVLAIGYSPAGSDHPAIEILGALEANGDDAAIAIAITRIAANYRTTDPVGQSQCRLLAAAPCCAVGAGAFLPAFRRIDAVKPDALTVDFDGVAVNDGGRSNDWRFGVCGRMN